MTMLSAVIKETKRGKKRKRRNDYESSDESDSDWRESAENLGNNVVQTVGKTSRNLGSDESHLFTQVVNKLSNDDNLTYVTDYRSNVDCLTNNLFVYNEKSFPAKVRKNVRERIQFSPEVVGVLLPDVRESRNNKKNSTNGKTIVRILLDSGASANTIRARHVKNYNEKTFERLFDGMGRI